MVELQDIVVAFGDDYAARHPLSLAQAHALAAIRTCRTAVLGGHVEACDTCGALKISYNSCRNRHCPKCQTLTKDRWVAARQADLLNVGYFHCVLTLPDALNPLAWQNPRIVYDLLFRAAAETVAELAADPKYLGAQTGMTAILHTWGQNLMDHPPLHCVVPGGGLTPAGQWRATGPRFFLPVKVLSRKFRGKFLAGLHEAPLQFFGDLAPLQDPAALRTWLAPLYAREWVVYCKPPFRNVGRVLEYLGRYTHRVALANSRIVSLVDGRVTFRWRDYRDGHRAKLMTLDADEFLRRFLLHVLPPGFTRIRHYGLLSPRNKARLRRCQRLTRTTIRRVPRPTTARALLEVLTGRDDGRCPACRVGRLQPTRGSPPAVAIA